MRGNLEAMKSLLVLPLTRPASNDAAHPLPQGERGKELRKASVLIKSEFNSPLRGRTKLRRLAEVQFVNGRQGGCLGRKKKSEANPFDLFAKKEAVRIELFTI